MTLPSRERAVAMPTPYDILGVTPDADAKTIRAAFRQAVKRYHPDVNAGDAAAEQRLKQVIAAYEALTDARRRAALEQARRLSGRRHTRRLLATALASGTLGAVGLVAAVVWTAPLREPRVAAADPPAASAEMPRPVASPAREPASDASPAFYLARGLSRSKASDFDGAIADFDAAIRLQPDNAPAYRYRAAALRGRGEQDRALADLDHAIRLGFSDAGAYNDRGLVWLAKGQRERAIADFNQAIKLDPDLAAAYVNRAMALRSKGDVAKAAADLDQAVRLDPALARYRGEIEASQ